MAESSSGRRRRRVWRFAGAEFDEASWRLRVGGQSVNLETKPLEVLHELLLRAGEVVSKEELLDAVWPGVTVVEGSLPTAISKLREAIGDQTRSLIVTVPRIGYRLVAEVTVESIDAPLPPRFTFAAGDPVPGRPQWTMELVLGSTGSNDVWLARHAKTGEARVFKFADAPDRLRSLKREAALTRLVVAGMGKQAPLPQLLEWNFDAAPFFLEYAYGGMDLEVWAKAQGGLAAVPLAARLALVVRLAQAVAGIHALGVLHKDLKPTNILIDEQNSEPKVRLADFGSGRLIDDAVLDNFAITNPGSLDTGLGTDESRSGTLAYRAPELAGDAVPTAKSDIYALGLILYQMVVGNFAASLAPGWEREVADPLLREDIALAAAGNPAERLDSAGALASRLQALDKRRQEAKAHAELTAAIARQQAEAERQRTRRPWIRAAAASVVLGAAGAASFGAYAWHQRNEARAAQAIADASYRFLAEDLLASIDPSQADAADESLVSALKRSASNIDVRFRDRPAVSAYLHATLARAYDLRSDYSSAFDHYKLADAAYARAGLGTAGPALNARLQHASALALSTQAGSLEQARTMVAEIERLLSNGSSGDPETPVWLASAKGMIALVRGDVPAAGEAFAQAHDMAQSLPDRFSPKQRINFGQRHAFSLLRSGDGVAAEKAFRPLASAMADLVGSDHPDSLLLRLNVGQALMVQERYREALATFNDLLPKFEKRLGKEHRHTLLLLAARQQVFGGMGRYADAAQDGERVWRAAAEKDGPASFAAVAGRADTGISQCRSGDYPVGSANIAAARTALQAEQPGRSALDDALRAGLADCKIEQGEYAQAESLLAGIDVEKASQLVGDANFGALLDLAKTEILLGQGRKGEAARLFKSAEPALSATKDPYVRKRLTRVSKQISD